MKQLLVCKLNPVSQQGPDAAADDGGAGECDDRRSLRSDRSSPSAVMCDAAGHTRDIYRTLPDRTPRYHLLQLLLLLLVLGCF